MKWWFSFQGFAQKMWCFVYGRRNLFKSCFKDLSMALLNVSIVWFFFVKKVSIKKVKILDVPYKLV